MTTIGKLSTPQSGAPLCKCGCGNRTSRKHVAFIFGHRPSPPMKARIWRSVLVNLETGCWEWSAWRYGNGYGAVWTPTGRHLAHRVSYEVFVGPIPDGLHIDHLCRVKHCVNPDHLEPVTAAENVRRADGWMAGVAARQAKTHCPRGHLRNEENTGMDNQGKRFCKVCNRQASLALYHRKRAAS